MTFSRIKNLTSKNLPKISEGFTIVINSTLSNAWFEGVSLSSCITELNVVRSLDWITKGKNYIIFFYIIVYQFNPAVQNKVEKNKRTKTRKNAPVIADLKRKFY